MSAKKAPEFVLSSVAVSIADCEKNVKVLRALLHPLRQKFLHMMDSSKTKQVNVTQIYTKLKLEQTVASQHLAILYAANLVIRTRKSRERLYSVNYPAIDALNKGISAFAKI